MGRARGQYRKQSFETRFVAAVWWAGILFVIACALGFLVLFIHYNIDLFTK